MNHKISRSRNYHGFCPPGYEKVKSYTKKDGTYIQDHCRKITVEGRIKAMGSGIYNESMIAEEDARLGFDSLIDSTKAGQKNADKIERRAEKIKGIMREQEEKKEEIRRKENE